MNYFQEIDKKSKLGFFRFVIEKTNDHIIVKYLSFPNNYRGTTLPDKDMKIIQMHIANIPDLVTAIFTIFQSNGRDSWKTTAHGDNLNVIMFDNERYFFELDIIDNSCRVTHAFQNQIEFIFEDGGIDMNDPSPHIPTPSMIWFTDTLKQIYDDWKNPQGGGQGAQVSINQGNKR